MSDNITCTTCNVMDIGTVIREDDCTAIYHLRGDVNNLRQTLIRLARSIENEPCDISEQTVKGVENGTIQMSFVFSCAAEKLIFDMRAAKLKP